MSMHTATNPGMNIEDELEAEIQRELDALEIDENEEENDADYPHLPEDKEEEDESSLLPSAMDYVSRLKSQADQLAADLAECDELMQYGSQALVSDHKDDTLLQQLAQEEGLEATELKNKILSELALEDEEDEKAAMESTRTSDTTREQKSEALGPPDGRVSVDIISGWFIGMNTLEQIRGNDINSLETNNNSKMMSDAASLENSMRGDVTSDDVKDSEGQQEELKVNGCSESSATPDSNGHGTEGGDATGSMPIPCAYDEENSDLSALIAMKERLQSAKQEKLETSETSLTENSVELSREPTDETLARITDDNHQDGGTTKLTLDPADAQVVEFSESAMLEAQAQQALANWTLHAENRQHMEQQMAAERQARLAKTEVRDEEKQRQREEKQKQIDEEHQQLASKTQQREADLEKEAKETQKRLEISLKEYQVELDAMAERLAEEQHQLTLSKEEREKWQKEQRDKASLKLQSAWRGFRVRKIHQEKLKEKLEQRKREEEERRIKEIEEKREKQRFEEEKKKEEAAKIEEETKRAEEERKRREKEEEIKRKEETERKNKEEEERKRKAEEERKKKEEQEKAEEEKRKREEDERKRKEEERRKEEELRKKEDEKKAKEAEEKRRQEEEERKKKDEEERKRKEEEDRKRKEEEEMKRKEEEAKKNEEEKRKQEEKLKIEEQKKKEKEEKQRQKELKKAEEKRKKEELKKRQEEEDLVRNSIPGGPVVAQSVQETAREVRRGPVCLPEDLEKMRLGWMKQCQPWSKTSSELKTPRQTSSKKSLRRPASAARLPPLEDATVFTAAKVASLEQVTTVELQDLPGFSLTTLTRCPQLSHLVLHRCHLMAVEGLEDHPSLQYADFSNNDVEFMNVRNCRRLVYLNLSHNRLSSLHGLEGCSSLVYLDASHNKITRIGGLESLRKLHTLKLSHNQLITIRGLSAVCSVQHLDISHNHLPVMDDLDSLGLLHTLLAASNSIMQPPKLSNHVLLRELVLDDNNLTSLESLTHTWLPLMQRLHLAQNGLISLEELQGCVSLRTLDVANNQILDTSSFVPGLSSLRNLHHLIVQGNPAVEENTFQQQACQAASSIKTIDGAAVPESDSPSPTPFEQMCTLQIDTQLKLDKSFEETKSSVSGSHQLGLLYATYAGQSHAMAVEHRQMHEFGDIYLRLQTPHTLHVPTPPPTQPTDGIKYKQKSQPSSDTVNMKNKFEAALGKVTSNEESTVAKDKFDAAVSKSSAGSPQVMAQQVSPQSHDVTSTKNKFEAALPLQPSPPTSAKPPYKTHRPGIVEANMGTALKNGEHAMRNNNNNVIEKSAGVPVGADVVGEKLRETEHQGGWSVGDVAATKIQALWRGYNLRRRIQLALEWARITEDEDDEDEAFKEIDLEDFGFNMADIDEDWFPPDTPQIQPSHPVLGGAAPSVPQDYSGLPPSGLPDSDPAVFGRPPIPPLPLFGAIPHPPAPRQAWRGADSPLSQTGKPPLPPLSRMSDLSDATCDTRRTAASKKSELLQEEWGFKDSRTAELMMQRAKKLKYNAAKKKKLSQLDPKQRLALFRCLEQSSKNQPVIVPRKVLPRKEYFQAKEEAEKQREVVNNINVHPRAQRTFEWIHTQVGDYEVTDSRINQGMHRVNSEGNLPQMTPGVLSGGRPSLTDLHGPSKSKSPASMDLQSIDSASNYGERRRLSMQDQSSNGNVSLPPIKTGSAPNARVKERMSWRDNPRDMGSGWGGGKKRAKNK